MRVSGATLPGGLCKVSAPFRRAGVLFGVGRQVEYAIRKMVGHELGDILVADTGHHTSLAIDDRHLSESALVHTNDHLPDWVILGDGDFLSNTYFANQGNLNLGLNIVNWLNQLSFAHSCSIMGLDECQLAFVDKPFS